MAYPVDHVRASLKSDETRALFDKVNSQWEKELQPDLLYKAVVRTANKGEELEGKPLLLHTLRVAQILWEEADVRDIALLACGILHHWEAKDLQQEFPPTVCNVLVECNDEPNFARGTDEEKERVIARAPTLSSDALVIKFADRLDSIRSGKKNNAELDWEQKLVVAVRDLDKTNRKLISAVGTAIERARPYDYFMSFFGKGELFQALTKLTTGDKERTGEDSLAASLFSCDAEVVARLLPEYIDCLGRLRGASENFPAPKPKWVVFDKGSPTWVRLAWKLRLACEYCGTKDSETNPKYAGLIHNKPRYENCKLEKNASVENFFAEHEALIDAHQARKFEESEKIRALIGDDVFFTFLCGKDFSPIVYATPKHLARSIFKEQDPATFAAYFDRYITILLKHPKDKVAKDLLKRLVEEAGKQDQAKLDLLSKDGKLALNEAKLLQAK